MAYWNGIYVIIDLNIIEILEYCLFYGYHKSISID